MHIITVVITYNRLGLLKECIAAIRAQTRPSDEILIINNSSTDGTDEWLATQPGLRVITQPNRGGAWGFHEGLRHAYHHNSDWTWIMDDDSIPEPSALQKLLDAAAVAKQAGDEFGFFGSQVLFTDRTPHLMNRQVILQDFTGKKDKTFYAQHQIVPVEFNSFVSLLVSREAVRAAGLPIKEFFIWGDDYEYTRRIRKHGLSGALVTDSIVIHKTPVNYASDIFTDGANNLWKYKHGLRNDLYIRRMFKGEGSYWRNLLKRVFTWPFSLLIKRKDHRMAFIRTLISSSLASVTFRPPIDFADDLPLTDTKAS
ncbi:glycosyltransferase family 2 protein [Terrimonas ferruginea]|uniref:glycosyltransferase family 2 protein n=1 Tax=Terrimonas ferruginea TaxID=249 RepID=UPI000686300E|nr:glycosyltransferase family 2 protein [Terrimonas ferruginea]